MPGDARLTQSRTATDYPSGPDGAILPAWDYPLGPCLRNKRSRTTFGSYGNACYAGKLGPARK